MRRLTALLAALIAATLIGNAPLLAVPIVYMGNSKGIDRFDAMDSDQTARTNIWPVTSPSFADPDDLAVDSAGGMVYWSESQKIRRGNIDGTGSIQDIVTTGPNNLLGLELDAGGGKVYWHTVQSFQRKNMDGTGSVETLFSTTQAIRDFTLDLAAGKVYWWQSNAIFRANLDGTGQQTLWSVVADFLAIDPVGGKIYWSNVFDDKIRRANADGTGSVEIIVPSGLHGPKHLALDLVNGKLYVQDTGPGAPNQHKYRRYNLDGSGHEQLRNFAGILTSSDGGIALGPTVLIPEPSSFVLALVGCAVLMLRWRRR